MTVADSLFTFGFLAPGLLFSGALTTVVLKVLFESSARGSDGSVHTFDKPWTTSMCQFFAMALCLPLDWIGNLCVPPPPPPADDQLSSLLDHEDGANDALTSANALSKTRKSKRSLIRALLYLAIPAACNVWGSGFVNVAIALSSPSVVEMLKMSLRAVFCAGASVLFLGRRLSLVHAVGICIICCGAACVAYASVSAEGAHAPPPPPAPPAPGADYEDDFATTEYKADSYFAASPAFISPAVLAVAVVIIAEVADAGMLVSEERLLSHNLAHLSPMRLEGYEGISGMCICAAIVAPLINFVPVPGGDGPVENVWDAAVMVTTSTRIAVLLLSYILLYLLYFACGISITARLGSSYRAVLATARTLVVWLIDLALFSCTKGEFGESWNNRTSPIQLGGFVLILLGILLYAYANAMVVNHLLRDERHLSALIEASARFSPEASESIRSMCTKLEQASLRHGDLLWTPMSSVPPGAFTSARHALGDQAASTLRLPAEGSDEALASKASSASVAALGGGASLEFFASVPTKDLTNAVEGAIKDGEEALWDKQC